MKKKILVLGSTGYIASSFIKNYKNKYKILASVRHKRKSEHKIFHNTKIIIEDILKKNFAKHKEDSIKAVVYSISLNAKESEKNYQLSKKINYLAVKFFCKFVKKYNIKKLIKLSTVKVYGNQPNFIINEKTKTNPKDNYSKHILNADRYLENFCKKNQIKYHILRVSNGFGKPSLKSKEAQKVLVNSFVIQALKKSVIQIKTKKNIIKNFISISDVVKCINFLISKNNVQSGVFLLSGKKNKSLLKLAFEISEIFLKKYKKIIKVNNNFDSPKIINPNFKINSNKLKKIGFSNLKKNYNQDIKDLINFYSKI
tara:strand:+ start:453 stop:1391 length:939 start_codon:yes stop_codon:yes gene_type:complete